MDTEIEQTFEFICEIDKLKSVLRNSLLHDGSRRENSAEHSWHLAIMVLLLKDYCDREIDLLKSVKMALIHDIVEVDAGDVSVFDEKARAEKVGLEKTASKRLFSLLPPSYASELKHCWLEYEDQNSNEARFVKAIDRIQPFLANYYTQGHSWKKFSVSRERVEKLTDEWADVAPKLAEYVRDLTEECQRKGYFF